MKVLSKYSIGAGDRFGKQGRAQIAAFQKLAASGVEASIVWNKSNREHMIIGTKPSDQRKAADEAVRSAAYRGQYCVDADHIGLATVEGFLPHCDFFTIDVADFIGKPASPERAAGFVESLAFLAEDSSAPVRIRLEDIQACAAKYARAIDEAAKVYTRIAQAKPDGDYHIEVSMDETDLPQSPAELAVILGGLAALKIPVQTLAPKFSGRFNKGVDYVGDVRAFLAEFEADARVALWASRALGLPESLKLSVHSGSDKFSIYPGIGRIIKTIDCGLHLKTAGTTWLEELIGLAEAGGKGLEIAKEIYAQAYEAYDSLVAPYAAVIDIDKAKLPSPGVVGAWSPDQYVGALRHDRKNPGFNPNLRQLLHVGYKVAAHMGTEYLDALDSCEESVGKNVTANLYERHMVPLFLGA
ncbi:MAG TPA: tagaturonate epimerase family protein [Rectinemataceae bacterium]